MSKQGLRIEKAKGMSMEAIIEMLIENENLIKEQKAFQDALKKEVDRIKGYKPWKRFFAAARLVIDLITTIEAGFKDI